MRPARIRALIPEDEERPHRSLFTLKVGDMGRVGTFPVGSGNRSTTTTNGMGFVLPEAGSPQIALGGGTRARPSLSSSTEVTLPVHTPPRAGSTLKVFGSYCIKQNRKTAYFEGSLTHSCSSTPRICFIGCNCPLCCWYWLLNWVRCCGQRFEMHVRCFDSHPLGLFSCWRRALWKSVLAGNGNMDV